MHSCAGCWWQRSHDPTRSCTWKPASFFNKEPLALLIRPVVFRFTFPSRLRRKRNMKPTSVKKYLHPRCGTVDTFCGGWAHKALTVRSDATRCSHGLKSRWNFLPDETSLVGMECFHDLISIRPAFNLISRWTHLLSTPATHCQLQPLTERGFFCSYCCFLSPAVSWETMSGSSQDDSEFYIPAHFCSIIWATSPLNSHLFSDLYFSLCSADNLCDLSPQQSSII